VFSGGTVAALPPRGVRVADGVPLGAERGGIVVGGDCGGFFRGVEDRRDRRFGGIGGLFGFGVRLLGSLLVFVQGVEPGAEHRGAVFGGALARGALEARDLCGGEGRCQDRRGREDASDVLIPFVFFARGGESIAIDGARGLLMRVEAFQI
jgi:hypothetical protein